MPEIEEQAKANAEAGGARFEISENFEDAANVKAKNTPGGLGWQAKKGGIARGGDRDVLTYPTAGHIRADEGGKPFHHRRFGAGQIPCRHPLER